MKCQNTVRRTRRLPFRIPHSDFCISPKAFSLIELMLVVGIIGVFSLMALPRFTGSVDRSRADAAARRVAADISYAQARARMASTTRPIFFDVANGSYTINGEPGLLKASATYAAQLSQAPYFASIATANFAGTATLSFNGYGIPASAGSVQITVGQQTRTITITGDTASVVIQ